MSRMFSFITETWNPVGGRCPYNCIYCWARKLSIQKKMKKYEGETRLIETELRRKFKNDAFVFVEDMRDLFSEDVPKKYIEKIFDVVRKNPQAKFLFLTKNPGRYLEFLDIIPPNTVLGATIESDQNYPEYSKAPKQTDRLIDMVDLSIRADNRFRLFVSVEPILDFEMIRFVSILEMIKPWAVAVGYDNYGNKLIEPPLKKTEAFIAKLEQFTRVIKKTLRPAWWEEQVQIQRE